MSKKYTVAEIDALRRCCEDKYLWGSYCGITFRRGHSFAGRSYKETEKAKCVEEMVRTFMLNGTKAEELRAADSPPCKHHPEVSAITLLDDEPLCQSCADAWCRGEGLAANEDASVVPARSM